MMFATHALIGGLAAAGLASMGDHPPLVKATMVAAGVLGALMPDIDEPRSFIGRRLPPLSILVWGIGRHRGFTHSLVANIIWGALIAWVCRKVGLPFPVVIAGTIGYLTHLVADLPQGVPLAWPFYQDRVKAATEFQTGSIAEKFLAALLFMAALQWVFR